MEKDGDAVKGLPFKKLSHAAKQRAIEKLCDLNVDCDWWDCTYEDAASIGLEITGFDLGGAQDTDGKFIGSLRGSIQTILADHGESCDTYKVALEFKTKFQVVRATERIMGNPDWNDEEIYSDLADDYKNALLKCYFKMLTEDYDYLTSETQIIESIEGGEYRFSRDGEMI